MISDVPSPSVRRTSEGTKQSTVCYNLSRFAGSKTGGANIQLVRSSRPWVCLNIDKAATEMDIMRFKHKKECDI